METRLQHGLNKGPRLLYRLVWTFYQMHITDHIFSRKLAESSAARFPAVKRCVLLSLSKLSIEIQYRRRKVLSPQHTLQCILPQCSPCIMTSQKTKSPFPTLTLSKSPCPDFQHHGFVGLFWHCRSILLTWLLSSILHTVACSE